MELLEHENIVQLRDNIYTAAHICLIMEYVSGVPLDDYMQVRTFCHIHAPICPSLLSLLL